MSPGQPPSAAAPSPFPPIADYAFLSDCHTGALVAPDGSIDWLCVPCFDAPSVFGSLLDREAGSFRVAPFGLSVPTARVYEPGTNTLVTTWHTPTGWAIVRDALVMGPRTDEDVITPPHAPARGRRRRPHAGPLRALPRRQGGDGAGLRAGLRLGRHRGRSRAGTARARAGRAALLRAQLGARAGGAGRSRRRERAAGVDSIHLHTRHSERLPRRLWPIVLSQAERATAVWKEPDQGIWEARGAPRHYVSSKLMCWVAMDRAAKLAEIRGDPSQCADWRATADEIRADILEHGVSERGVLRQHYDTDALDASNLLAGIFGFLPGSDPVLRNTVLAIADELTDDGYVLRYRTDETDDGLSGKEGSFLICSLWLVSALAQIGESQQARDLMERLPTQTGGRGAQAHAGAPRPRLLSPKAPAIAVQTSSRNTISVESERRGPSLRMRV